MDATQIKNTTQAIIAAREMLAEAREQVFEAKEALKDIEMSSILDGVAGKNEKERDANLRQICVFKRNAVLEAEKRERAAILELEVCKDIRRCQENIIAIENMKEA